MKHLLNHSKEEEGGGVEGERKMVIMTERGYNKEKAATIDEDWQEEY